jgi:hypothetical protein
MKSWVTSGSNTIQCVSPVNEDIERDSDTGRGPRVLNGTWCTVLNPSATARVLVSNVPYDAEPFRYALGVIGDC